MAATVGIQFQKNGKIYKYDANGIPANPGDYVVAETSHGADLGQIVTGIRESDETDGRILLKKVLRLASEKDLQTSTENRIKEREAYETCQRKIAEHKLDMKLVSVEYAFDGSKALFYFTANGRVDFRSLVKDLASAFKMRIELRQIGVRDEARMLGGLGPCGREICCGTFLDDFQPVSIKMAKEQNLSLNPTKISGLCGRLMCCLKYEQDHYEQTRKIMPRIGREVATPDGIGTVSDLNIVKETVFVRIANGDSSEIKEYPLEKIEKADVSKQQFQNEKRTGEDLSQSAADEPSAGKKLPTDKLKEAVELQDGGPARTSRPGKNPKINHPQRKKDSREHNGKEFKEHHGAGDNASVNKTHNNTALGKPVMRENPNKKSLSAENPEKAAFKADQRTERIHTEQDSAAPMCSASEVSLPEDSAPNEKEIKTEPKSNWADAVRKAIDSIN